MAGTSHTEFDCSLRRKEEGEGRRGEERGLIWQLIAVIICALVIICPGVAQKVSHYQVSSGLDGLNLGRRITRLAKNKRISARRSNAPEESYLISSPHRRVYGRPTT